MYRFDTFEKTIELTRGDKAVIRLERDKYGIEEKDLVAFRIYDVNKLDELPIFEKEVIASKEAVLEIILSSEDTKIGEMINKSSPYWYEIEVNNENTIIGFDSDGPKELILYPEGKTKVKEKEHIHEYSEWEIVTESTCTEDGEKVRSCIDNDAIEKESIPALGHEWIEKLVGDPFPEYDDDDNIIGWQQEYTETCLRCHISNGPLYKEHEHNYVKEYMGSAIPKLDDDDNILGMVHKYKNVCSSCGYTTDQHFETILIADCDHEYERKQIGAPRENVDDDGNIISYTLKYNNVCPKCGDSQGPFYETTPVEGGEN